MRTIHRAINAERLAQRLKELSQIGRLGESGVCRLAMTPEDKAGVRLVRSWMDEIGLATRMDAFGNLIGHLSGSDASAPILMLGSHIDSQPYGGRFDGAIGVLGALEAVQTLLESGVRRIMPIEVVAFSDEEGCRFNKGLFGSRGITGKLEEGELERVDRRGVTRLEALRAFGGDPNRFADDQYAAGAIAAYLELHIEQGQVLEATGEPIGIVSGIAGPLWLTVALTGEAGHAGSVPMALRKDALAGAAEVITALNGLALREAAGGASIVGTVGSMSVFPDSRNIIPERVTFTVDLRDIDVDRRRRLERELRELVEEIVDRHGLTHAIREDMNREPSYCADWIKSILRQEAALMGLAPPELMSGPFHDALALSEICDYGMIFVRSRGGISHHPAEYSDPDDIAVGVELLYRAAARLATDDEKEDAAERMRTTVA
ncbi:amidase, hydantoinase/carbamoylase family [Paenibacillus curdlanolyticus YK9]|uniref:Amidase, hydantoinase/carbamoylase family n=1 Tax=Paenibacillus curdlanolyticus YK9 TaxID=717606 RepID=E0IE33_9BACL|nr:Zn-dependent hydrolase [Paenibacillus curdlanolyticus]EFM09387.1 amidase, hydantoinase/carbamoylase family [Paenibacillus curdlanolyticus YK9]